MNQDQAAAKFEFYPTEDYFAELADQISKTVKGDRVVLTSMTFDSTEPPIAKLVKELLAAASRQVDVTLIFDSYSFISNGFRKLLPLVLSKNFRAKDFYTMEVLEELRRNGGKYSIINRPKRRLSSIYAGRFHAKISIINNRLYVGGCNLMGTDQIDMMVGWDGQSIADQLADIAHQIYQSENSQSALKGQDINIRLSDNSGLIIDAGMAGQSSIMDKAMEIIDEADESIVMACQYYPNSVTAKHLIAAHKRGVKVVILHNHPRQHDFPNSFLHALVIMTERIRTPKILFQNQLSKSLPFIHSKLIATEKSAIMGSHNFVMAGVNFGTTEIALHVNDPAFASRAIKTITDQLASVSDK